MKYLKKFESLNEAKMFDDYKELIAHSKKYLGEIYIERPLEWKKKIKDIIEASGNTSFYNTSLALRNLSDEVRKDFTNLQNFYEDINAHIKELDEIYQKSEQLSPEDEKGYDELEKIESQTSNYIDFEKSICLHHNQLKQKNYGNTFKNWYRKRRWFSNFSLLSLGWLR